MSPSPRTNIDILRQAIHRAEKNGWNSHFKAHDVPHNYRNVFRQLLEKFYMHLMFDHNFARAFWGDKYPIDVKIDMVPSGPGDMPAWKFFLGEMARKDDPIAYLGNFIHPDAEKVDAPSDDVEALKEELHKDQEETL